MLSDLQPNGLKTFKKDILLLRTKRRQHQDSKRRNYTTEATPNPLGGQPIDWKVTVSQRFTYRSESSEPHIKPSCAGTWHWEKEPLEHLALKASGTCAQELHRTEGNGDPILKRCT